MKRIGNLLPQIADSENLRWAFWKAKKGKKYTQEVLDYQLDLEANLLQLQSEILSGNVEVGDYHYFKIYDPKEREICASAFREQVLHHALMSICHPYFERYQISDSYASRPKKGVHVALNRAKQFTKPKIWFLKLDVRKFFASIPHSVLKEQLERGLPFCGYIIRPGYVRLSQRSKRRFIVKMENLQERYHSGEWSEEVCQRVGLPLVAFTRYGEAKGFRQQVINRGYLS